jgi:aminoglycoside 6'-N-acetyltransferase I
MRGADLPDQARIVDLTSDRGLIDETARLLFDAFQGRTEDWQDLDSAKREVEASLGPDHVSRVLVDPFARVLAWIGALPIYGGRVWEIHPLVVGESHRRQGVGRALVEDLERCVAARGALTLWVGSDDEHGETTLSGTDLYPDIPAALAGIQNLKQHPYGFYLRIGFRIAGVVPDANGLGKPDILLAKRVSPRPPVTYSISDRM